ncbi:MAG: DUF5700 domain-containing putative Zn-dependent protease [Ignavibacteriales bacterium]
MLRKLSSAAFILFACAGILSARPASSYYSARFHSYNSRIKVSIITDEAEAVLKIAGLKAKGQVPQEADWQRLFSSEGYVRLKKRELFMKRSFEDSTFRTFVLSPDLARRLPELTRALKNWEMIDVKNAAQLAFNYLPSDAVIRAKIYPVIKPRENSFVFETNTDPAIFMYINPALSSEQLNNTLTHELHHIGTGSIRCSHESDSTSSPGLKAALDWMSGFSEGRAMLAAATSPEIHPHATSDSSKRAVWERDLARAEKDIYRMEQFFNKLLDDSLSKNDQYNEGMSFVFTDDSPQGAFYTVGWLMASTIEKSYGRQRLISSLCDPYMFISDYNKAAMELNRTSGKKLPLWSSELIQRICPEKNKK